jgi:GDP-4-dehydro-6-deoxy-D-mannose reductase
MRLSCETMSGPILITGSGGFVGGHLQAELGDASVPFGGDVLDAGAIAEAVRATRPQAVVHLAAESSVGTSWGDAGLAWSVNVVGTVNVLEAVRHGQPIARVLFPSTGEVYGEAANVPTREDEPVAPLSPYAATKAAAELACTQAARTYGLDIVVARAFPHEGPGRDERFAIGSWTRQIARLESEGGGMLLVGDLSSKRDFTDVRDVSRAYRLLLDSKVPAGTYNVASGRAVSLERVVELLVGMAEVPIRVEHDPSRLRRVDIRRLCGDASRLRSATGWQPRIPLERTLSDALAFARQRELERVER